MTGLRKQAKLLAPIVRIGKNKLTQQQILEIEKQLKKKKMIKIKILKSADLSRRQEIIQEVVNSTGSKLVDKTGNTFTVHKP